MTDLGCAARDAIAAIRAAEQRIAELERDARRLDWMIGTSAHVAHNRDGDACRVWRVMQEDIGPEPVGGQDAWFDDARTAIDAAMEKAE